MTQAACMPSTFDTIDISWASILSITANLVLNHTTFTPLFSNPNHDYIPPTVVDFCNVTVSHMHTGHNESIQTRLYLPLKLSWNGRLQGLGGGGFIAGLQEPLVGFDGAIAEGYAAVGINAGFYTTDVFGGDSYTWALPSPGVIDMHKVHDFAYRSLGDMVHIGKQAVEKFYGEKSKYSYFSGCSGGGRQGYVYAQRYPDAWDGIAACAPGIYWDQLPDQYWAQLLMNVEGRYPWPCELIHLRDEALAACDELDGVKDGVMQDPDECHFEAKTLLGQSIECPETGGAVKISDIAVRIAGMSWKNMQLEGVDSQMPTSGYDTMLGYLANTVCANWTCKGDPNPLSANWIKIFVEKDKSWDPRSIKSFAEFEALREKSVKEYEDSLGLTSYDLSAFRDKGGKMITYQGMSDFAISYKTTQKFFDNVQNNDPSVHDYYRLFMAPGLEHTAGGRGAYPHTTFHALVNWVEKGIAPDTLEATSAPDETGRASNRRLCAYPRKSKYDGKGDPNEFGSWICV